MAINLLQANKAGDTMMSRHIASGRHEPGRCAHFGRACSDKTKALIGAGNRGRKPSASAIEGTRRLRLGKTYEEIYGEDKAAVLRASRGAESRIKKLTPMNLPQIEWGREGYNQWRQKHRAIRQWMLRWYRTSRGCADCGEKDCNVLTFDHENGDKEFDIARGSQDVAWPKLWAEVQKCAVVCFNCHMKRERVRQPYVEPPIVNWAPCSWKNKCQ